MARRGPTWAETGGPGVERRTYETRGGSSRNGRSTVVIVCPWCTAHVTAYLWSLAGGGKRCDCGALFGSTGTATHWQEVSRG